jgi:hypothetical protein
MVNMDLVVCKLLRPRYACPAYEVRDHGSKVIDALLLDVIYSEMVHEFYLIQRASSAIEQKPACMSMTRDRTDQNHQSRAHTPIPIV